MMKTIAASLWLVLPAGIAAAEDSFPATLAGHAVLPAMTLVAAPADAPADARISGKFTGPARADALGSVMGDTGALHGKRPTGISLPFDGQPVQGLSGFAMERAADGSIYVLTDNGFGAKGNSADALLFFHRMIARFRGRHGRHCRNRVPARPGPEDSLPHRHRRQRQRAI